MEQPFVHTALLQGEETSDEDEDAASMRTQK